MPESRDIMVVTGGKNSGDFLRLLANGKDFGLKHIAYTYQEGEGGIADALGLCEHFADGQKICVVLGDNIIEKRYPRRRRRVQSAGDGARILLKEVPDAERFGVAEFDGDRIVGIEEKPAQPKSNYAVTGIYMYDASVFDKIHTCKPSRRNELEITDVNNAYIREGTMTYSFLDGWWTDAGTFDSLLRAANLVAQHAAAEPRTQRIGWREDAHDTRRSGHRNSEVRKRHRRRDSRARFAQTDRRREMRAVRRLARRSRLSSSKCSAPAGAERAFPERNHADFGGAELSRHHQGVPFSSPSDGLLDARP